MRKFPVPVLALVLSTLVWCPVAWAQTVEPPSPSEFLIFFLHLANLDAAADRALAKGNPNASAWKSFDQRAAGLTDDQGTIIKEVAYACNQALSDHDAAIQKAAALSAGEPTVTISADPPIGRMDIVGAAVEELQSRLGEEVFQTLVSYVHAAFAPGLKEVSVSPATAPTESVPSESGDSGPPVQEDATSPSVEVYSEIMKMDDYTFFAECYTTPQDDQTTYLYAGGKTICRLSGTGIAPFDVQCNYLGLCSDTFNNPAPGQTLWIQGFHGMHLRWEYCTGPSGETIDCLKDPMHYFNPGAPLPDFLDGARIHPLGGGPVYWAATFPNDVMYLAATHINPVTFLNLIPRQVTLLPGEEQQFTSNLPAWWSHDGPGSTDATGLYQFTINYKAPASVTSAQTDIIEACDHVFIFSNDFLVNCQKATVNLQPVKVELNSPGEEVLPGEKFNFTATVTGPPGLTVRWTLDNLRAGFITATTDDGSKATFEAALKNEITVTQVTTIKACVKLQSSTEVCATATVRVPKIDILLSAEPPTHVLPRCEATNIRFAAVVSGSSIPRQLRWVANPNYTDASLTVDTPVTLTATYKPPTISRGAVFIKACFDKLDKPVEELEFCSELYPLQIVDPIRIDSVTGNWTAGQLDSSFTITGFGFGTLPTVTVNGLTATVVPVSDSLITGAVTFPIAMGGTPVSIVVRPSVCPPAYFPSPIQTSPTIAPVSRLEVSPAAAEVRQGGSQPFSAICLTAQGTLCDSPDATLVQWTASQGTIDPVGPIVQYRAPASVPASTTATVTACWGARCAPAAVVRLLPPVAVTVSPETATVSVGQTQQFTATVANDTNTAVTWSLEPSTLDAGRIDQSGLYSAPATLGGVTTVTVIATSQADATRKDTATVTLEAPCAPQYKPFQVLAGRCSVTGADRDITVTPGFNFEVRTALQPTDGSAVDSRCFKFEWTSSLDPTPASGQSFTVPGVPMILTLKVTSLDNAYSDSITLTVKTDPNAYNSCVRRRSVRSSGGSSSGGSSSAALSAHSSLIQLGESVTLSPPEGIDGSSFDWHRADPNHLEDLFSHDETVVVSPTVDTRYWLVYRYTDGNGVSHEEQSENHYVLIQRPAPPRVHIEPRFQVIPADTGPVMEVIDDAVTDGNYDGYTFEWNVGSDNTRPSTPLPWPYRRLVLDRAYDSGFWCKVTDRNGNVMVTEVATVAVTCSDGLRGSIGVSPGNYLSRTDRPVVSAYAQGLRLSYDWFERLPEETTPRPYSAFGAAILPTPAQPLTYYSARIQDACGQTAVLPETPVYLCVPTIDAEPADQVVPRGGSASLTAAASPALAGQPVTITWRSGETGQAVGSGPTLSVTPAPGTTKTYYAEASADCSGTPRSVQTRAATVTGCALAATAYSDRNVAFGQTAALSASVSGTEVSDVEYTWYYGPAPGTEYTSGVGLSSIAPAPQTTTTYWVRVKDGTCTADSNPVTVRVCLPTITSQPQGTLIRSGQTASLSVGVVPLANETLQYQWYAGASGDVSHPASGATSSTFTTPALTANTTYWARVTSSCGATVNSAAAVVAVCNNPAISSVTPTRYIRYGESTWHQVYAAGNNLTYQWYTGSPGNTSAPISGATQASIAKSPAATTAYWARVTSSGLCTTDSPAMVIDVCTDPPITTQPASKTISSGQSAPLTVATSATGAIYQWYLGTGASIQGATSASLTVTPTADTQYYAQVTRGACTSTSSTAAVTVCTLGASLSGGANIASGQSATLGAGVSNSRVTYANYEWYAGTGANSLLIAQGSGLGQKTVNPTATTQYWVRVSDGTCTVESAPVTVSVCKPTITAQPQGTTANSGQTATLSVSATGAPLSYQWYIGAAGNTAQPIAGATSASYTTPPMSTTASYWVRVTGCATADSAAATINVCALPVITSGPTADTQRFPGTTGWMTVTATGTNLTYQWFTGQSGDTSMPVSGCNSANCSFTLSTSKYYWVRIIGTCGTLNSPAVIHPVSPTITQQPQSASVPPNATPTLSVAATGTTLTYQWYRGTTGNTTTPISGATAATFTVPPVSASASYWCKVTSAGDSTAVANSAEATLSLCTGPTIYYLYPQYLGYNQWRLSLGIGEEDLGNVYCAWYTGVPGNVAQSVLQYEGGTYTNVLATGTQTWWCRAWYSDNSCYTDTGGATIYKVQ